MLSVIVPVYNVAQYVEECLNSLDMQTLSDIEIIIVDDGSKDNSYDICRTFVRDKPKFKLYHKENGGLMSAWMYGLNYVAGDYIGFVDSDDYISADMYNKMYKIAKSDDIDIIMCSRYSVNKKGARIDSDKTLTDGPYIGDNIKYIHSRAFPSLKGNISTARWNKIFKMNLFLENTKYCIDLSRYCEDRYIVPPCLFSASSFYYLDEPLYFYRERITSNCKQPSNDLIDNLTRLVNIHSDMLADKNLREYSRQLEISNLNYIQIIIERNLSAKGSKKNKLKMIGKILRNEEYNRVVKKYPDELAGKFGKMLKIAFKTKNSVLVLCIYDLFHLFTDIKEGNARAQCFE